MVHEGFLWDDPRAYVGMPPRPTRTFRSDLLTDFVIRTGSASAERGVCFSRVEAMHKLATAAIPQLDSFGSQEPGTKSSGA